MGGNVLSPILRVATPDDARECGIIRYEAFKAIAEQHRFPSGTPSAEFAAASFSRWISHPGYYVVVAELDRRIIGSNVLDERSAISGLGPITVDPTIQNRMVGSRLMEEAFKRVSERRCPGVRLVQATYHTRSLCLYTKLGFEVRELLANLQGPPLALEVPGHMVRPAQKKDLEGCNALCRRVHGHDRSGEVLDAITEGTATVVEHEDRLTGYATMVGFAGHAVAESNADLQALIGSASEFVRSGFLLPTRNGELFRWCLDRGLRMVQPFTLMSMGLYNEPRGAFLPSIIY